MGIKDRLRKLEERSSSGAGGGEYQAPMYARVFLKRVNGEPLTDEEREWEREADRRLLQEYIPSLLEGERSEESRQQARQLEAHVREKVEGQTNERRTQ